MNRALAGLLFLNLVVPVLAAPSFEEAMALYDDKQYAAAREIAEREAKTGNVRAMVMLGLIYQKGQGVAASINQAVDWFARAADKNDVNAEYALAQIYLDGALGKTDNERGQYWPRSLSVLPSAPSR